MSSKATRNRCRVSVKLLAFLWSINAGAATYFFDTINGDDTGDGAAQRPFRTIGRANGLILKPGDELRFRGGQEFAGNLVLDEHDAGTSNAPVVIGSFGSGRAHLRAGAGTGILVRNAGGIVVSDLEVSGSAPNRNLGAGVRFENSTTNRLAFIQIRHVRCHGFGGLPVVTLNPAGKSHHYDLGQGIAICATRPLHQVYASPLLSSPQTGGAEARLASPPVRGFSDVLIEDCEAFDCQGYGIHFDGPDLAVDGAYAHSGVRVQRCLAHDNPGDGDFFKNHSGSGILLVSVEDGWVEQCRAWNNGAECKAFTGGPCGIWAASSTRITIRRCESFRNRTGLLDGAGFDFDGGVTDSVIEQCYSHENDGAGFLLYSYAGSERPFSGNWCRFNLSVDDNRRGAYGGICVGSHGGSWKGVDVAHNTVITDRSNVAGAALCLVTHGRPENIRVWNNLFVTRGQVPLVRSEALPGLQVVGNVWWNDEGAPRFLFRDETFHDLAAWRAATGLEQAAGHETGIVADPGLHLSDETLTVGDRNWLDVLASYRLPLTSPMRETEIRSASWLASLPPGIRDFFEQVLDGQAGLLPGADARVIPVQKK